MLFIKKLILQNNLNNVDRGPHKEIIIQNVFFQMRHIKCCVSDVTYVIGTLSSSIHVQKTGPAPLRVCFGRSE